MKKHKQLQISLLVQLVNPRWGSFWNQLWEQLWSQIWREPLSALKLEMEVFANNHVE